jgi:hypothetical protein
VDTDDNLSLIDNDRFPNLPSYLVFDISKKPDENGSISFEFLAPDIVTQLHVMLNLINVQGPTSVTKFIDIEK